MTLDIKYSKLCIRIASLVAKRRKTCDLRKLEHEKKISKLGSNRLVPQLPSKLSNFTNIFTFFSKYFVIDCTQINYLNISCKKVEQNK